MTMSNVERAKLAAAARWLRPNAKQQQSSTMKAAWAALKQQQQPKKGDSK